LARERFSEGVTLPFEAVMLPLPPRVLPAGESRAVPRVLFLSGSSSAARIWAAALAVESGGTLEEIASIADVPPRTIVVASGDIHTSSSPASFVIAASEAPDAEMKGVEGLVYEPHARAAAGRSADAARFSVSRPLRTGGHPLARSPEGDRILLEREDGGESAAGARIVACGTDEDLGRLLHEGTLGRLCRVILSSLTVPAAPETAGLPLTLSELKKFGGTPFHVPVSRRTFSAFPPALLLFSLALFARLLDARSSPPGVWRGIDRALFVAATLCLVALVLNLRPETRRVKVPQLSVLGSEGVPDATSRALAGRLAERLKGRATVQSGGSFISKQPAIVRLDAPVSLFVASRSKPPRPVNVRERLDAPLLLVGDGNESWAEIAAVDAPERAFLGRAIGIAVTVRASSPASIPLALRLSDRGGLVSEVAVSMLPGTHVLRALLPFRAGTPGRRALAVSVHGAGAEDVRGLTLSVGPSKRRIVILSASPSWEGRSAARLLAGDDAVVVRWIRVGRSADLFRTTAVDEAARTPFALLALDLIQPGDVIVLEGFGAGDLDARVEKEITAAVEKGAGLLILGPPDREFAGSPLVALLPARLTALDAAERPLEVQGESVSTGTSRALRFKGFVPFPAAVSPGAAVLGTLGPTNGPRRPWLVGRAVGRGRVLRVLSADLWRAEREGTPSLSRELVAWVTAPVLDDRVSANGAGSGDSDDILDELAQARRPRLRVAALAAGVSYEEAGTLDEAVRRIERLRSRMRIERVVLRRSPLFAALLMALIAANVAVRRLRATA
jgi:hypothetical protein